MVLKYLYISILVLSFSACQQEGFPKDLGKNLCGCRSALLSLNQELIKVQQSGDQTKFVEMLRKIETASDASEECTEQVLENANVSSEKEYEEAMQKMSEFCPELSELF